METKKRVSSKHENRGILLFEKGLIQKKNDKKYIITSSTNQKKTYEIDWNENKWTCTCQDYAKKKHHCKHIHAVTYYLEIERIRTNFTKYQEDICPICDKNDHVIKRGKRYNQTGTIQRYKCKKCKKQFSGRPAFKNMKHKIETIISALDLYYRGLSLRQISEHLRSTYKTKVSHVTIYNWIKKYVTLIATNSKSDSLLLSDKWHLDETLIKVSGRHLRLWALLDSKTRFLIASHISEKQKTKDAEKLIKKGKQTTKKNPNEIVTDGLSAYPKAIKKEMKTSKQQPIIHLQSSLTKAYNNKMERLMGTIKYRTKPMLGFKDEYSAEFFSKGFTIYYNYIRNHKSLNNQSPAVAAGIIKEKMTWLELIEKTEKKKRKNKN